jgi:hypothetical protein
MDDRLVNNNDGIIIPREYIKHSKGKTNHSANLLTKNHTLTGLVSNPALIGERPAAKHLNYSSRLVSTFTFPVS